MIMFLDIEPPRCTAQHKGERIINRKYGKPFVVHYQKKPQALAERMYLALLSRKENLDLRNYKIYDEKGRLVPLSVSINFAFRSPIKRMQGQYKTTRPDCDNMAKGLLDCLTKAGYLADDSQIACLTISKLYAVNEPFITIAINDLSASKKVFAEKIKKGAYNFEQESL